MNITHLRAFVMVVEHGSFSGAARAMDLSQPAVTMQIQGLEADLGATLFDRAYRRIELTEAGRVLLPIAQGILGDVERAHHEVAEMGGRVSGRLAIAASTTPGQYVLPRLLGRYLTYYPEVGISLTVSDTAGVIEAVTSGAAHIGMTGARVDTGRVRLESIGTDELVMICPPNHPLASAHSATMDDAAEEPFIMRREGSGTRLVTEEVVREAGIDPDELRVLMELGTSEAIVSAVEGGMGLGVVSQWMVDKALELGTVARVPLARFPVSRPFYVVLPKGEPSRAAAALLEHLRDRLGTGTG
ncbi:MAG: selenium metabolism-associated LysR family transcriptional regulator [Actinomycetota bacterium]|nr:selenium metabolism-associated LysR family transcriptional regulator [Actinomycetota bacterium]